MAAKEKPLAQRVRDVLTSASDPLKAGEIRELLADDELTSEALGTALYQLCVHGHVEKIGERGAYRYLLVPGGKPGKPKPPGRNPDAAAAPERRRPRPQLPVAAPPQSPTGVVTVAAALDRATDKLADLLPSEAGRDLRTHTVMLPRRTLRQLVAALLLSGADLSPYQDAIAEAARESA